MRKILAVLAASLIAACTAYGPVETDAFQKATVDVVPESEGNLGFAHSATWLPDTGSSSEIDEQAKTGGALLVTEKSVIWVQWERGNKRFEPVRRIPASDIKNVSRATFDDREAIVVESKDLKQDAFVLVDVDGSSLPAANAIEHGQAAIRQLITE